MKDRILVADGLTTDRELTGEEEARAWLFRHFREQYGRFCYKIEDTGISNKPFDSIIDTGDNVKYFVEFKYDRHKKFDAEKIKATTKKQIEPLQMATIFVLKEIRSDVYVITYVRSTKTFLVFKY